MLLPQTGLELFILLPTSPMHSGYSCVATNPVFVWDLKTKYGIGHGSAALGVSLLLPRTQNGSDSSHMPATLASRDMMPSSGLRGHGHTHTLKQV